MTNLMCFIYFQGLPTWLNFIIGWLWVLTTIGNFVFLSYVVVMIYPKKISEVAGILVGLFAVGFICYLLVQGFLKLFAK